MEFIEKHKKFFVMTLSFLCITTMIITVLYREKPTVIENAIAFVVIPINSAFATASDYVVNKVSFYTNINKIEDDNYELNRRVAELEEENKRLRLVDEENKTLTELLELEQRYPQYKKTGAYVIGGDLSNWYEIFLINKGTNDGISKNMVVLTEDGLAGKILEAGANYSKVLPIIDDTSLVAGTVLRTGDNGLVRGDTNLISEGMCIMENININASIVENDEILTSNLSGIYPPGITIGYVREVTTDAKGLSKNAVIELAVDFKNLKTVSIITESFIKDFEGFEDVEGN